MQGARVSCYFAAGRSCGKRITALSDRSATRVFAGALRGVSVLVTHDLLAEADDIGLGGVVGVGIQKTSII